MLIRVQGRACTSIGHYFICISFLHIWIFCLHGRSSMWVSAEVDTPWTVQSAFCCGWPCTDNTACILCFVQVLYNCIEKSSDMYRDVISLDVPSVIPAARLDLAYLTRPFWYEYVHAHQHFFDAFVLLHTCLFSFIFSRFSLSKISKQTSAYSWFGSCFSFVSEHKHKAGLARSTQRSGPWWAWPGWRLSHMWSLMWQRTVTYLLA